MAETITLDPSAVATGRTQFDLTPFISVEGVDWGDAQITAQIAEGMYGGDTVDFRVPNRQVTIPLKLMARGTATFEQSRRWVQAKAALFQREGGWLSRVTGAGTLYADVVNATLKLGGDWLQANKSADIDATLSLECKPDWYGAEITLDDKTETTLPVLTTVLKLSAADAVIGGDYPNRVRIVVDEDDGDTQLGLIWGFRARYYDSASTAALFYQAEALTPLDTASVTADGAASGGTVVRHLNLATEWTPVLSTRMLAGTADLTHRGTYRVWARCFSVSGTPWVRFVYDVGDLVLPEENTPQRLPTSSSLYWVDLGEIRLDAPPVGTHRWQGVVQGRTDDDAATNDSVNIDVLAFQPVDDGCGKLTVTPYSAPGMSAYSARDTFVQTAGTLTGKTALTGGTWAGAGDADDFTINTTAHTATRGAVSDASSVTGRFAILGTATPAAIAIQADFSWDGTPAGDTGMLGVLCRYVDVNNWLICMIRPATSPSASLLTVYKNVASSFSLVKTGTFGQLALSTAYTVRLRVDADGRFFAWGGLASGPAASLILSGQDTVLATGGALDDGKIGLYDVRTVATASTRTFDNLLAWVPDKDAVVHASQSVQLTTGGIFREDVTGIAYGALPSIGGLPRLPPSGLEGRKVELFLKLSRGDFDQLPDAGIDDVSAQAFYRPSWLIAPGS